MTTLTKEDVKGHVLKALYGCKLIPVNSEDYYTKPLSIDSFGWCELWAQLEEEFGTYMPCNPSDTLTNKPNCTPKNITNFLFAAFQAQNAAALAQSSQRKFKLRLPWGKRR